jgi:hypothetical protein
MLYLYGIVEARATLPALPPGLADVTPEVLPHDDLGVVVSTLHEPPRCDQATARRHMDVLGMLMASVTVLPARFGTVFFAREELDRVIAGMRDTLHADLRRLSGKIELGLCVTGRKPPEPDGTEDRAFSGGGADDASGPGSRYLAAKRVKHQRHFMRERENAALAARVCGAKELKALVSGHYWRPLPFRAGPGVSVAFLLPREHLDVFHVALGLVRAAEPGFDFLCTGPWPPFSFVSTRSL